MVDSYQPLPCQFFQYCSCKKSMQRLYCACRRQTKSFSTLNLNSQLLLGAHQLWQPWPQKDVHLQRFPLVQSSRQLELYFFLMASVMNIASAVLWQSAQRLYAFLLQPTFIAVTSGMHLSESMNSSKLLMKLACIGGLSLIQAIDSSHQLPYLSTKRAVR